MVKNQINHHDNVTDNHHKLTSNPVHLLPKPVLWFQLSRGDLIIIPLIIVMLRFTLQSFQLNITLNQFQIRTPIRSNQFMMMKWTFYWNSSIQNMMMIFWMLTSICFRLDWLLPLLQKFIQSLLCCFINIEEIMLQSQILCRNFICLY